MKKTFTFCFLLFAITNHSQVSFTMNTSACLSSSVQATASSGTITSPSYTWASSPAGVVFSNTNSASPVLTFTAAGNYSVGVIVISGTVISYAQSTINVIANGALSVVPYGIFSTNSVCPQTQFTLEAFAGAGTSFSVFTAPNTIASIGTSSLIALTAPLSASLPFTYTIAADSAGCLKSSTFTLHEKKIISYGCSESAFCLCRHACNFNRNRYWQ